MGLSALLGLFEPSVDRYLLDNDRLDAIALTTLDQRDFVTAYAAFGRFLASHESRLVVENFHLVELYRQAHHLFSDLIKLGLHLLP